MIDVALGIEVRAVQLRPGLDDGGSGGVGCVGGPGDAAGPSGSGGFGGGGLQVVVVAEGGAIAAGM